MWQTERLLFYFIFLHWTETVAWIAKWKHVDSHLSNPYAGLQKLVLFILYELYNIVCEIQ